LKRALEGYSSFESSDEEDEEDKNPHGFIDPEEIKKFRKTKSE